MREILFRAKRTDNGGWETGNLVVVRGDCSDEQVFISDKMTGYHTPVLPETVGQFTGLTDCNGRAIFEGDILRVTDEHKEYITFVRCDANTLCVDIFFDNTGVLELDYDYTAIGFAEDIWKNCKVEVIGNIHDNPELLGVRK